MVAEYEQRFKFRVKTANHGSNPFLQTERAIQPTFKKASLFGRHPTGG
jgi:hypothetical protein